MKIKKEMDVNLTPLLEGAVFEATVFNGGHSLCSYYKQINYCQRNDNKKYYQHLMAVQDMNLELKNPTSLRVDSLINSSIKNANSIVDNQNENFTAFGFTGLWPGISQYKKNSIAKVVAIYPVSCYIYYHQFLST